MSHLLTLENISLSFGSEPLLNDANLQLSYGERVCLIGRNGAGKSSLFKVIEGKIAPDAGSVLRKAGLRIAKLSQELPENLDKTVFEFVAEGLEEVGKLLSAYNALTQKLSVNPEAQDLTTLQSIQHQIDAIHGWQFEQRIRTILQRLELDPKKTLKALSGGWQRRAALARALVSDPELLLLDEPTNHLDIEAIQWLEDTLLSLNIGVLFITHDRALLQRLATRILELDRGQLTSWPGDYQNFLRRKEEMLHAENKQNKEFDKKLAQEEQWIRQGIKARRTRNEGRVRALEALRVTRAKRRVLETSPSFSINEAEKSGALVVEAEHITQQYGESIIIQDFSIRIMRGDRIGLIGPNGIGKSTLLNILLGNIEPQQGSVRHGTKLKIAYFDQLRKNLDLDKTVVENVGHGSDFIEREDKKQHIMSYLRDFLFTPERALTPVKALSGGECNRLLLARLFSLPRNVLVLDEPTNDLDIETLELLEELLSNYQGTLLLVSHDREFLDNVVTSTLSFEGNGKIQEYVGGYQDWLRQRKQASTIKSDSAKLTTQKNSLEKERNTKKLSYKEQQELLKLPNQIETLEIEQDRLQTLISQDSFYQNDASLITQTLADLKKVTDALEIAYRRWEELEKRTP